MSTMLDEHFDTLTGGRAAREAGAPDYAGRNSQMFAERAVLLEDLEAAEAAVRDLKTNRPRAIKTIERSTRQVRATKLKLDRIHEAIAAHNIGLVKGYARRFRSKSRPEDTADFEAAGIVGLVQAIKSYDPEQGPFAQWAYHPIQRAMTRAVRDADYANMNPGDFERRPDILNARTRLRDLDEGEPTEEAIAVEANVTVEQVQRVLRAPKLASLNKPIGEDGDLELSDVIADDERPSDEKVVTSLSIAALERWGLTALDARELFVIVRHFGLDGEAPSKLATIGDTLGLSREAARQIEARGLAKLSHPVVLRKLVRQERT